MNTLMNTIKYFFTITAELTVLFLGISTFVALVLMYIPMTDKNNNSGCCSGAPGCCGNTADNEVIKINFVNKKQLTIDLLFLDLSVCTRCQGTDTSLDEALSEVSKVLEATGTEVVLNKINVNTKELAVAYKFITSPTIRVNGHDIQMEVHESLCESCGDLCGDQVDCRVWVYQGQEYTVPPKAMIIEAILKEVYGGKDTVSAEEQEYIMPENLKHFYSVMEDKK